MNAKDFQKLATFVQHPHHGVPLPRLAHGETIVLSSQALCRLRDFVLPGRTVPELLS